MTEGKTRKRILFVTETCFYPPYQGDSARILSIISYFKSQNWHVSVLHFHDSSQTHANYKMMEKLCDVLQIYYPTKNDLTQRNYTACDSWCPEAFIAKAREVLKLVQPSVMYIQFVFFSACLNVISENEKILKVIDADNIFSERKKIYHDLGINYQWFSTTALEERQALLRADLILAIQEREQEKLTSLVPERPVHLVPHVMETIPYQVSSLEKNLLFVAAANAENTIGLKNFLEIAFPKICEKHENLRLIVAGKICDNFSEKIEKVDFLGIVPNLEAIYQKAMIVLNTTPIGTGLKIKTVEALCYGKCLVTTADGVAGLENYQNIYHLVSEVSNYASVINHLLSNKHIIDNTSFNAHKFSQVYFNPKLVLNKLEMVFIKMISENFVPSEL